MATRDERNYIKRYMKNWEVDYLLKGVAGMSLAYSCELCCVSTSDSKTWAQHITGKRHQAQLNQAHLYQQQAQNVRQEQVRLFEGPADRSMERPPQAQRSPKANEAEVTCALCSSYLPDEGTRKMHMKSRRHLLNVEKATRQRECGVFVSGIPPEADSQALRCYFESFGQLDEFVHIPGRNFLLLQYNEREVARSVLQIPICLFGRRVMTRPRRPSVPPPVRRDRPPPPPAAPPGLKLDHGEVVRALSGHSPSLEALVRVLEMPPGSECKYEELRRDLEYAFRPTFVNCSAVPFGSTVTGLALRGSDIDIFLSIGEPVGGGSETDQNADLPSPEDLVVQGRKLLRKMGNKFTHVVAVAKAKIPIVKFVHVPTRISCDVSFRNARGVCNSRLIRFLISLDVRVRPFLLVVKYWARVHELASPGRMSNYALVMMCLFYLQRLERPILPTVAELQAGLPLDDLDDGWLCRFSDERSRLRPVDNTDTVFRLLRGFFLYFSEFDFGSEVICPLLGRTVPKTAFYERSRLPDEMRLYKEKGETANFKYQGDMCVQDPFDLSHNLTGRMGTKALSYFCAYCQSASELFNSLEEAKYFAGLIQLFDVKRKPMPRKLMMTPTSMVTYISVAQYLSLGYMLRTGKAVAPHSDGSNLKLVKIYRWCALVYDIILKILERVMKFTVKEEGEEHASKVQKVGEPSDVHLKPQGSGEEFTTRTVYCESTYNVWEGRRKVRKALKLDPDSTSDALATEETISNAIVEKKFAGEPPKPLLKFSCTFEPIIYPVQVSLVFHNKDSLERSFVIVMSYLQTRLPQLVDRCLAHLMKEQVQKQSPKKAADATDATDTADTTDTAPKSPPPNIAPPNSTDVDSKPIENTS